MSTSVINNNKNIISAVEGDFRGYSYRFLKYLILYLYIIYKKNTLQIYSLGVLS